MREVDQVVDGGREAECEVPHGRGESGEAQAAGADGEDVSISRGWS